MKRSFVVIIPDGSDRFFELDEMRGMIRKVDIEREASRFLVDAGFRSPRNNPRTLELPVFELLIKQGQLVRKEYNRVSVVAPPAAMTETDFNEDQAALLEQVPVEFHAALSAKAYEDGHSNGWEEIINNLDSLVDCLIPAIKAYTTRLLAELPQQQKSPVVRTKKD